MSDSLLLIGKSGALAARSALETTGHNIANAATEGYQRRTAELAEVASRGGIGLRKDSVLSGVRFDRITRSGSDFLHAEARRTGSDLTRADAELAVLRQGETALEQSGVFSGLVEFEAGLAQLAADPLNPALRAQTLENARTLADAFGLADAGMAAAGDQARFEAADGAAKVTLLAGELARNNAALVRVDNGSGSHAGLLDRRDALLAEMAEQAQISAVFDEFGAATVRLGDSSGPQLVGGFDAFALDMTENADGTIGFAVGGDAVSLVSGGLAGKAQALGQLTALRSDLDALAARFAVITNDAQAAGVDIAGNPGAPFFSGSTAGSLSVVLAGGAGLATAPAGSGANSRDTSNLDALRAAFANGGPAADADALLFSLSSAIAGREITRDALGAIAGASLAAVTRETGVDLDSEAANLIRFQQAFQASSRVIQVSGEIFDTLLGLR